MNTTHNQKGFTLIETLIAITVLVVAISAPLTLAQQSLTASIVAKDQVIASQLAQEGIEMVRWQRDANLIQNTFAGTTIVDWMNGIPSTTGSRFTVDSAAENFTLCPGNVCPALQLNGPIYNHTSGDATRFTRYVTVVPISGTTDEVRVESTVVWRTGSFAERSFTIAENMYNWVPTN